MKKQPIYRPAPRMELSVTQKNINEGCRKNAALCAVAHAVLDRCPQATFINCSLREISWSNPRTGERSRYFPTAATAAAIIAYDRGDKVKPFMARLNNGVIFPTGWKAKHPGSSRVGKVFKRTGIKRVVFTRRRSFGACNISIPEIDSQA